MFKGSQKAWNSLLKPTINTSAPFIGTTFGAKIQKSQFGQATRNYLKSMSGGKFLNLTDRHGQGLRLRVR